MTEFAQPLIDFVRVKCLNDEIAADYRSRLDVVTTEVRDASAAIREQTERTPSVRQARVLVARARELLLEGKRRIASWDTRRLEEDAALISMADELDQKSDDDDRLLSLVKGLLGEEERRQKDELSMVTDLLRQIESVVDEVHELVSAAVGSGGKRRERGTT